MKRTFLILIIALSACSKESTPENTTIQVDAQKMHQANIPYVLSYPAVVQGMVDYPIVPRVSGTIYEQYYKEGSLVKREQALYKIDPRPFELQLKTYQGQLIKDKVARDNYQKIYERYKDLYESQVVSKQDLENARINYFSALGNVKIDQANIEKEKLNLHYCLVLSPVDGFIGERSVTVGTMVTAFQTVLNHVNSSDQMYLLFSMPEKQRLEIEDGLLNKTLTIPENNAFSIDIELADGKVIPNVGKVEFTDTRINANDGSWNMRAYVNNDVLANKLLSGQYVNVHLQGLSYINVFSVPQDAILFDDQGPYVYVIQNDKAVKHSVKTGKMLDSGQWIVTGLTENDVVITAGVTSIQNDTPVTLDHLKE